MSIFDEKKSVSPDWRVTIGASGRWIARWATIWPNGKTGTTLFVVSSDALGLKAQRNVSSETIRWHVEGVTAEQARRFGKWVAAKRFPGPKGDSGTTLEAAPPSLEVIAAYNEGRGK